MYQDYLATKRRAFTPVGFAATEQHPSMFDHQRCIVEWACRLGRAAIFADTGLGKTRMQIEWARQVHAHTGQRVLLLAPLAVGDQTIAESESLYPDLCGHGSAPVQVINYERLHHINPADFGAVVLDESSILKSFTGRTRTELIDAFRATPYRLACTATPSPNDHTELGNHAEFLGVCSYVEMLAEFFVHDSGSGSAGGWRIKGHAVDAFWKWVSSWAVVVRRPSDLGYDDGGYALPDLRPHAHTVAAPKAADDLSLFAAPAMTLQEQRVVRRGTVAERCALAAELAAGDEPCIVWCELNDESAEVARSIDGAIEVTGSDESESKREKLIAFTRGEHRVMVTKPSIAGFGMNWQHCARMVFVGSTHSFEQYYQAVRRCWRFGQTRPVDVHVIRTDADDAITSNLARKIAQFEAMGAEVAEAVRDSQLESLRGIRPGAPVTATVATRIPRWLVTKEG